MIARGAVRRAFLALLVAQFLSSLADNALLIAAIGLLMERQADAWIVPALRIGFYLSYVALAPVSGAVADAVPKDRVIFGTTLVKLGGCWLLLAHVHPLLAYGLVGFGAAAYAPAKYGLLPELLAPEQLVAANAWIEVSTVLSILLGAGLGSLLMTPGLVPQLVDGIAANATVLIAFLYAGAALAAMAIPAIAPRDRDALSEPRRLVALFRRSNARLWGDREARLSLAVTSLFWAISAMLQFLVLRWAVEVLGMSLAQAALMQGAAACGMVAGALAAAYRVPLGRALSVMPLGLVLGVLVLAMALVHGTGVAVLLLVAIGAISGLFLVPMNALLQARGSALMDTGQSIAVQNCSENVSSLVLLAVYGALLYRNVPLRATIAGVGITVVLAMGTVMLAARRSMPIRPQEPFNKAAQ